MRLWQLRKHWEGLAAKDPLWAVLTSPDKHGNRWKIDEFFATGVAEVERDLQRVREVAGALPKGAALDFGCGAGRLTQALGAHFPAVTGVDISRGMIEVAKSRCRNPSVDFVHNTRSDLRAFKDGSLGFVYSRITLQHIAPRYTRRYLGEFVRVLAAGGVLSVQIPARVPAGDPPERLKFSAWPPTLVMRIRRYLRYHHPGWFPDTPKMQMYALDRDEVEAILKQAGARVLCVDSTAHGHVENLTYIARKAGV